MNGRPPVPSEKLLGAWVSQRHPLSGSLQRRAGRGGLRVAPLCLSLSPAHGAALPFGTVWVRGQRSSKSGASGRPMESPSCLQACLSRDTGREGQAGGGASMPVGDLTWGGILLGLGMSGGSRRFFTGGFLSHTPAGSWERTKATGQTVLTPGGHFPRGREPPARCASLPACVPLRGAGDVVPTTPTPVPSPAAEGAPGKEKGGSR